ncbi:MAG: hypothetical protein A3J38_01280 [Gammaproteobacteria bacterium RIFCSPHIGHO2_12_FULL_45_9]|nr:MAG: hypothetical protein A3J38_01280 [Gammaproteobacteria bacterium RIFCSPHIGHO2_12_FULL_45_9]
MLNRHHYTPEAIKREVFHSKNIKLPLVLAELWKQQWRFPEGGDEQQIFYDLTRQTKVSGETYQRVQEAVGISIEEMADIQLFTVSKLGCVDSEEAQSVFLALSRCWNQKILSVMKDCLCEALLDSRWFFDMDYEANITRDAKTGTLYIEATLSGIKVGRSADAAEMTIVLPGTIHSRFQLTAADRVAGEKFQLDFIHLSNGLLRDLCFISDLDCTQLAELAEEAKREEHYYQCISALTAVLEDGSLDTELRQLGQNALAEVRKLEQQALVNWIKLAEIIHSTTLLLEDTADPACLEQYLQLAQECLGKYSMRKLVIGAMLALAGAVVIVSSVSSLAPAWLAELKLSFGESLLGRVVAWGSGTISALGGGILLFKGKQSQPVAVMGQLSAAKQRQWSMAA